MLTSKLAHVPSITAPALTIFLLGACSDASLTSPTASTPQSAGPSLAGSGVVVTSAVVQPIDISGTWRWHETTRISARPFTAEVIFGIEPEGPMTIVTCESGGELTLTAQTPTTFVGSATQSSTCRTQSGIEFNPVPFPFPPAHQVENGKILGHSFRFDFTTGGSPCPHTGAVRVQGGQAVELRGSGDCALPDEHELVGSYKDITFVATR